MPHSGPREQKCKYSRVVTCSGLPFVATSHMLSAFILRNKKHKALNPYVTGTEGEPWRQILKLVDTKINITFNS